MGKQNMTQQSKGRPTYGDKKKYKGSRYQDFLCFSMMFLSVSIVFIQCFMLFEDSMSYHRVFLLPGGGVLKMKTAKHKQGKAKRRKTKGQQRKALKSKQQQINVKHTRPSIAKRSKVKQSIAERCQNKAKHTTSQQNKHTKPKPSKLTQSKAKAKLNKAEQSIAKQCIATQMQRTFQGSV